MKQTALLPFAICSSFSLWAAASEAPPIDAYLQSSEDQYKVWLLATGIQKIRENKNKEAQVDLRATVDHFETTDEYETITRQKLIPLSKKDTVIQTIYAANAIIVLSKKTQNKIRNTNDKRAVLLYSREKGACSIQ